MAALIAETSVEVPPIEPEVVTNTGAPAGVALSTAFGLVVGAAVLSVSGNRSGEVVAVVVSAGFQSVEIVELPPYHYGSIFTATAP